MTTKNISLLKLLPGFILVLLVSGACKKLTDNELNPVVKINSVTLIGADTAAVTGYVTANNGDDIQYEGVCYGHDPLPAITENQLLYSADNATFTIHIPVKQDSTYYFRCFAANSNNYGISAPVKLSVPHAKPAVAPCSLTNMKFTDNGATYTVNYVYSGPNYASNGIWGLEADCNGGQAIRMDFSRVPTNGVYVTGAAGPNGVGVEMDNFNSYYMQSGDSVYVAENADSTLTFSFCTLHYSVNSVKVTDSGKFTTVH